MIARTRTPARIDRIGIRPEFATVIGGGTSFFDLLVQTSRGARPTGLEIFWEVANPLVGIISSTGVFVPSNRSGLYPDSIKGTAIQNIGDEQIRLEASADVRIIGPLASLTVNPDKIEIQEGGVALLEARPVDSAGARVPGVIITWKVSQPEIGTVNAGGLFQAGSAPGDYPVAIQVEAIQAVIPD